MRDAANERVSGARRTTASARGETTADLLGCVAAARCISWRALVLLAFAVAGCSSTLPRHDLRVTVISDLNSSYGSTEYEPEVQRAIDMIVTEWRPDLVLAAGDLIAAQKTDLSDEEVRAMWNAFDSLVAAPLRGADIPFGFTLGNHDASGYPAYKRDREIALAHWRAPERNTSLEFADSAQFPIYYSFTEGDLFVLVWDASTGGTAADSTMIGWVRDALSGAPARSARYRIVLGHLPLYGIATGRDKPGEVLEAADSLRALLEQHNVDAYVSGHHHAYYPGRRGSLDLLYSGALGQGPRQLVGTDLPTMQTVTILDFDFSADTLFYTTYALDEGELKMVDLSSLPPVVRGFNGYVIRRDMSDSDIPENIQSE